MGLLDDAIREHLDLKRRNGGDPGEIARKENEALAPVFPAAQSGEVAEAAAPDEDVVAEDQGAYSPDQGVGALAGESGASAAEADADGMHVPSGLVADVEPQTMPEDGEFDHGQETAELDMETVLDADEPWVEAEPASAARPAPARPAAAGEEESFEWELPGDDSDAAGPPPEIPGQERLSFD